MMDGWWMDGGWMVGGWWVDGWWMDGGWMVGGWWMDSYKTGQLEKWKDGGQTVGWMDEEMERWVSE